MINTLTPDSAQQPGAAAIARGDALRSYEDAATAIGRLDASGRLAPAGLRELLVLRCIVAAGEGTHQGMIALLRPDGEGDAEPGLFAHAVREGAARARGGALPSVAALHELLRLPAPAWSAARVDDILLDVHERTPPVLKSALAVRALCDASGGHPPDPATARLACLAVTLVLCVGGATTDAWLTLPLDAVRGDLPLRDTLVALAREARAAERGLATARERIDEDWERVRTSLGRASYSALDVLLLLQERLVITIPDTARALGLTPPTAGAAIARLAELGIVREITGKARSRAFAYDAIVRAVGPQSAVGG